MTKSAPKFVNIMKKYLLWIAIAFCTIISSCKNEYVSEAEVNGEKSGFKMQTIYINYEWFYLVEDTKTGSKYLFKHNSGAVKLDK